MGDFLATLEISNVSGYDPIVGSALPFVIMWIVDMGFDASGAPAECGMALGAPHLVAAFDFVDSCAAFGAGFGVFVEQFGGFEVFGITGMWAVVPGSFDYMTLIACPLTTQSTFPLSTQESSAIFCGAGACKMSAFAGNTGIVGAEMVVMRLEGIALSVEVVDEFVEFSDLVLDIFTFDNLFDDPLGGRQEGFFAF